MRSAFYRKKITHLVNESTHPCVVLFLHCVHIGSPVGRVDIEEKACCSGM
jgi:hypothetical protein